MNRTLKIATILMMTMMGTEKLASANSTGTAKQIAVHIRNYARIDQNDLQRAGEIAAYVLGKAGVEAIIADESGRETASLRGTELPMTSHFQVNILSPEMARRVGLPMNVLGVAPGSSLDPNRTTVYVFADVAENLVQKQNISVSQILGHAMAHEVGHVLLNVVGHSQSGIMRATWKQKDFTAMTVGALTFDPEQVTRIQAEVTRRNQRRLME